MSAVKNARPTPVRLGIMERHRPELVETLSVRHLSRVERLLRATKRSFSVMGVMLLVGNVMLLLLPFPYFHLCLFPLAFVAGPIVAFTSWRDRVLMAQAELPCPRCKAPVMIPEGVAGWPVRFNCNACAAMVELNAA